MTVRLVKQYHFEAAHQLSHLPAQHPCARLHGHSYQVELALRGPVDPATGWLIDFGLVDQAWKPIADQLDHRFLNDLPGLEISTCENLCRWIWQRLVHHLPHLVRVTVWETHDARCEYEGE